MPESSRDARDASDRLFILFVGALALVLLLFGIGMIAVILWESDAIGAKMLNVFAAMFSGLIGLGSGYLLGARKDN